MKNNIIIIDFNNKKIAKVKIYIPNHHNKIYIKIRYKISINKIVLLNINKKMFNFKINKITKIYNKSQINL
jgi:hypothetical protein